MTGAIRLVLFGVFILYPAMCALFYALCLFMPIVAEGM